MKRAFKILRTLILWGIISLTAELGGFYYINNVFLNQNGSTEITPVDIGHNRSIKNSVYDLPSGADITSVKFSDDNLYMAFKQNGDLKVKELATGKVNIAFSKPEILSSIALINGVKHNKFIYEWVPERHRLLMTYPSKTNGSKTFKLYSYDAEKNEKRDEDSFSQHFAKLSISPDRYITALSSSGITGSTYVKIDGGNRYSKIFYYDNDNDVRPVHVGSKIVDSMVQLQHEDKLFFSDTSHSSISMFYNSFVGATASNAVDFHHGLKIIGANANDKVYAAKVDGNDFVSKIYYLDPNSTSFIGQDVQGAADSEVRFSDLLIKPHGDVYINDKRNHYIIDALSGAKSNYQGTLLQITDKYMICYGEGNIRLEAIGE